MQGEKFGRGAGRFGVVAKGPTLRLAAIYVGEIYEAEDGECH